MPRRELLSPAERQQLTCLPNDRREIEAHYTLTPADRELVAARRGDHNRLGFAVQLCFLRHPGWVWTPQEKVPAAMLRFIASQVGAALDDLATYAQRDETRREHLAELQQTYGWQSGTARMYRELSAWLTEQARGTDNGMALMASLIGECRRRRLVVPPLSVLERLAIASRSRARAAAYRVLTEDLTPTQRQNLESLLDAREQSRQTNLGWVRQSLGAANPTNILSCLDRLTYLRGLGIPSAWSTRLHQNRLVQIAREGAGTDVAHLRTFAPERRYATLVACVLDATAVLTDDAVEMHERFLGKQFKKAERKHLATFQENGKVINDALKRYTALGRAIIEAKTSNTDPYEAIEKVLSWGELTASVTRAEKLIQPGEFDSLSLISGSFAVLRRYAPQLLNRGVTESL